MEMNLGYAKKSEKKGIKFWPVYVCFIIFGIIIPYSKPEVRLTAVFLSIIIAGGIGLLTVNLLVMLFNRGNQMLHAENNQFAREAVSTGMLFMIPFTVLAVLAQLLLDWNAAMPFASAAMMTATATAGTEVMKKGAHGMKNILMPSLLAFVFSTTWMMLVGILP
ncbi:hypothetical protein LPY66_13290 [Dehalobacter sp. DCM]|uniref:hypothetical protein n=1 Tax=Dehalobacter sp. DCM TaxID=2907827 RepID=UPI003081A108|nr:hypothetical protein LPY66_13290 [Dehalobacter sp. DCM]